MKLPLFVACFFILSSIFLSNIGHRNLRYVDSLSCAQGRWQIAPASQWPLNGHSVQLKKLRWTSNCMAFAQRFRLYFAIGFKKSAIKHAQVATNGVQFAFFCMTIEKQHTQPIFHFIILKLTITKSCLFNNIIASNLEDYHYKSR